MQAIVAAALREMEILEGRLARCREIVRLAEGKDGIVNGELGTVNGETAATAKRNGELGTVNGETAATATNKAGPRKRKNMSEPRKPGPRKGEGRGQSGGRRCLKCGAWKGWTGFAKGEEVCRKCQGLPMHGRGRKKAKAGGTPAPQASGGTPLPRGEKRGDSGERRVCALCSRPKPLSEFESDGHVCRKCGAGT